MKKNLFQESIEFRYQVLGISFVVKKVYFCDKIIAYIVWKVLMIKYLKGYQNAGRDIEKWL